MKKILLSFLFVIFLFKLSAQRQMENLDRGFIAINTDEGVFLSWRILGTDPADIAFNIYRDAELINNIPYNSNSNFIDKQGELTSIYKLQVIIKDQEIVNNTSIKVNPNFYYKIKLKRPENGISKDGNNYSYTPNDMSIGDLDGDGQWDLILKWEPSNSHDNSHKGYTGIVYLDSYKIDGTFMWRINLGKNIRAGAHYTQFLVGDYDGDGKSELVCKTAPGTKDGTDVFLNKGQAENDDDNADYRNENGFIVKGPEYLTIFEGSTGREMATIKYVPERGGDGSGWGDNYGNRVDRFLATNAYLNGKNPSMVFQRGYYTRMALTAYDWDGKNLKEKWTFDSNSENSKAAIGQGNHNLSAGDIDEDGFDEIIEGSCAIDHDGTLMYSTGLGHGDAIHFGDLDHDRRGLEVWQMLEDKSAKYNYELHDAKTGEIIWGGFTGTDNGRGLAADIDPLSPGYEMWSRDGEGIYSCKGKQLSKNKPSINFRIYWDGDLLDELLDGTVIEKWTGNNTEKLIDFSNYSNASKINGTKSNPCLQADLFGDWREEVILYNEENSSELIIFTTTILTTHKLYTLMHDPIYRLGISWQNTAYNQPPHLSFFLGNGIEKAPKPHIKLVKSTNFRL
jgi:hypothetical protein